MEQRPYISTQWFMLPQSKIMALGLKIEERFPSLFYCLAFIFSYQLVTLFDDMSGRGLMELIAALG